MSHLHDLIARHCPNGVPFKRLGEIGELVRGNGMQKSDLTKQGVPAIHYGQIHTYYRTWATETIAFVTPEFSRKLRKAAPGDIVIATTSEDDEAVGKAVAWIGEVDAAVSSDAYIFRHTLNPKYVAYFFQSVQFHEQKKPGITGTKVRRVSGESLAKIKIPVPPIEVQGEIVRVLDLFAGREAGLIAHLEAELEARRKQYAYYRDLLLNFKGGSRKAQWIPLGQLGTWTGGITPSKAEPRYWDAGTIPWIASMDISASNGSVIRGRVTQAALDENPLHLVPAPLIAVVMRSNILRRVLPIGYITVDSTANQDIRLLRPRDGVDARFIYQTLLGASEDIRKSCVRTDGSMAAVDSKALFEWMVPIPPIKEQRRIVAILDKFDALVNDLSAGLPAEIRARRKQYEYYRDQLLTFVELI